MNKNWNTIIIKTLNGSLSLFAVILITINIQGTRVCNLDSNLKGQSHLIAEDIQSKGLKTDSIPQGKILFELYFSEWDGRMKNLPVHVKITGNKIIVYNNEQYPLTGGKIIAEGILMKHKSGRWIIGNTEADINAKYIGGCTSGPSPIDFKTKIIEWC